MGDAANGERADFFDEPREKVLPKMGIDESFTARMNYEKELFLL